MKAGDPRNGRRRRQPVWKYRTLLLLSVVVMATLVTNCVVPELAKFMSTKSTVNTGTTTADSPQSGHIMPTIDSTPARKRVPIIKDLSASITLSSKPTWKFPLQQLLRTVSSILKTAVRLFCGMPEEHGHILGF